MDFLTATSQYSQLVYPLIIFYLIGIIGIILVIFRPYWAFLFALFCLAARNFHAAVFTRIPIFGPYVNLNDLLLWIAIFAMFFELIRTKKMLWMPKILFAIFLLVFIGDVQSLFKYGTEEHVLRRIWSTAIFPILFLVSANMVKNEERARFFYWALFLGAVFAAVQHMFFIMTATFSEMSAGEAEIRTISYIMSGGYFLIISSFFTQSDKNLKRFKIIFYYIGIALIALSYILSLTRGFYVIGLVSLIIMPFVIKEKHVLSKGAYKLAVISIASLFLVNILLPNLDMKGILNKRFESFVYKGTFLKSYETRLIGQQTELELWMDGILIFGEGSSLPFEYEFSETEITGALYHVAYSTYLAHYGLIGLFIYGILLPIGTIFVARRYYLKYMMDYEGKIALIAIACALFDIFALPWSHHHLFAMTHVSGLIYGAIWGLYRTERVEERIRAFHKYSQPLFTPSSAFGKYGK